MKSFVNFVVKKHPYIGGLAAILIVATAYLSLDALMETAYFALPSNNDRPLESWMSPRFVGMSWELPREVIVDIMEIDDTGDKAQRPRTLYDVMARTGLTLDELQSRVEAAEAEMKQRRGDDD
ncbi:MAG: hypothetical protein AAGG69_13265 [Pseudomonadota bacterium]